MTGYRQALLLDNSAWVRAMDERLAGSPRKRFDSALTAGELWTCPPSLLEMLYSARDEKGFALTTGRLSALLHAPSPPRLPRAPSAPKLSSSPPPASPTASSPWAS